MVVWKYASFVGFCLLQTIWAEDAPFIHMDCPATFQDSAVNEITCTTLTAQAEKEKNCNNLPEKAVFLIKRNGSETDITLCNTDYTTEQSQCNTRPDPGKCVCTGLTATTATFTYSYIGNSTTDTSAHVTCSVCGIKSLFTIPPSQCDKINFMARVGEPCGDSTTVCATDLECHDSICMTVASMGEPCGDSTTVCATGLECHDSICMTVARVGEPCGDSTTVCATGLECHDSICMTVASVGKPCGDSSTVCATGMECHDSNCVTVASMGKPCGDSTTVCATGMECHDSNCGGSGSVKASVLGVLLSALVAVLLKNVAPHHLCD